MKEKKSNGCLLTVIMFIVFIVSIGVVAYFISSIVNYNPHEIGATLIKSLFIKC